MAPVAAGGLARSPQVASRCRRRHHYRFRPFLARRGHSCAQAPAVQQLPEVQPLGLGPTVGSASRANNSTRPLSPAQLSPDCPSYFGRQRARQDKGSSLGLRRECRLIKHRPYLNCERASWPKVGREQLVEGARRRLDEMEESDSSDSSDIMQNSAADKKRLPIGEFAPLSFSLLVAPIGATFSGRIDSNWRRVKLPIVRRLPAARLLQQLQRGSSDWSTRVVCPLARLSASRLAD